MVASEFDSYVRRRAFQLLAELVSVHGDVLPFRPLSAGFQVDEIRVPLLGPQGIFKPKILDIPLSITTAPNGPYDDSFSETGLLRYRYRGTDRQHRDNVGLREAMSRRLPLIYLHGIVKGKYIAAWPVFVVADNPGDLSFTVAVDDMRELETLPADGTRDDGAEIRRRYITSAVRVRLHQRLFRERVIAAYRESCALCRLHHPELLDAAHIIPDSDELGEPHVSNGLSLCKLHHAAFDKGILGIRPDLVAEIRLDILEEVDGPMLRHGLQEMHGAKIWVPRSDALRPKREALELRYEQFVAR